MTIRNMTPEVHDILTNHEAIAVDQDPLGKQGTRLIDDDASRQVWIKELSDRKWAVCILNTSPNSAQIMLKFKDLPFVATETYHVRDLL